MNPDETVATLPAPDFDTTEVASGGSASKVIIPIAIAGLATVSAFVVRKLRRKPDFVTPLTEGSPEIPSA